MSFIFKEGKWIFSLFIFENSEGKVKQKTGQKFAGNQNFNKISQGFQSTLTNLIRK